MRTAPLAIVTLLAGAALASGAPIIPWQTVSTRPHDTSAFTEGLTAHAGELLESTGLDGASSVRRVKARTGKVIRRAADPTDVFGEGLTVLRGTAWQLTWRDHRIYGYNPRTLARTANRAYPYEGWGLTTDGASLIASDGSATLRWLNPRTMRVRRTVSVTDEGQPITNINELEMINGAIWADVWLTDRIAVIDPADGHVRAWLDLGPLNPRTGNPDAVLNGIAVDPVTRLPLVTGKLWPRMFVIRPEGPIPA